jgi:hypothetical protein
MREGQIWRQDGKYCLILGKCGSEWLAITLNSQGHGTDNYLYLNPRRPSPSGDDSVPFCFWWVWPSIAVFYAENLPEYFKKLSKNKAAWVTRVNYNMIWS